MTNVGNMPLDIYQDYLLDIHDIDFPWYMMFIFNGYCTHIESSDPFGSGVGYTSNRNSAAFGFGNGYGQNLALGYDRVMNFPGTISYGNGHFNIEYDGDIFIGEVYEGNGHQYNGYY